MKIITPHENKINDAYACGMAHGRNGFAEGLKVYRAAMAGGVK